jgi:uncharacterized protein YndB with AHSA1/START domain
MSGAGARSGLLRLERTFNAPATKVFEAWTSAEVMRRWWHAEHNWETPLAEVDGRVGGAIRVAMRNPADGTAYIGRGKYTVLDPPRRLAFTWAWESNPSAQQLIEVEFIDHGDRTTVVLTNAGLPEEELGDYRDGWEKAFDNLELALAR